MTASRAFSSNLGASILVSALLGACALTPPETELPPVTPPPPPVVAVAAPPAPPPPPPPPAPPVVVIERVADPDLQRLVDESRQFNEVITDVARLSEASPDELKRELTNLQSAFNRLRTDHSRLRLSIALSLSGEAQRALNLLEPLVSRTSTAALRSVAVLIAAQISDRLKMQRDDQKKLDAVQQKLDGLRDIERALGNRRSGTATSPGPAR